MNITAIRQVGHVIRDTSTYIEYTQFPPSQCSCYAIKGKNGEIIDTLYDREFRLYNELKVKISKPALCITVLALFALVSVILLNTYPEVRKIGDASFAVRFVLLYCCTILFLMLGIYVFKILRIARKVKRHRWQSLVRQLTKSADRRVARSCKILVRHLL